MYHNGNYGTPGSNGGGMNSNNINITLGTPVPSAEPASAQPARMYYPPANPAYQHRSKTVYDLLALALGAFGIHAFYFGHKTVGSWMIALCILSVGALSPILWLWAVISIFTTTAPKGYYKYGRVFLPLGTKPSEAAEISLHSNDSQSENKNQLRYIYAASACVGLAIIAAIYISMWPETSGSNYKSAYVSQQAENNTGATPTPQNESATQHAEEAVSGLTWEQVCELADPDTDLTEFQIETRKKEYIGQRVKWSGKVLETESGAFTGTVITMRVGSATGFFSRKEIECKLVRDKSESKKAAQYKKNEDITIIGTIQGIDVMGTDVVLKDAVIAK